MIGHIKTWSYRRKTDRLRTSLEMCRVSRPTFLMFAVETDFYPSCLTGGTLCRRYVTIFLSDLIKCINQCVESAHVPSSLRFSFLLLCCRNCEDFCDCNWGSSVFTHFPGLVHHQQHQTGDHDCWFSFSCSPTQHHVVILTVFVRNILEVNIALIKQKRVLSFSRCYNRDACKT